MLVALLRGTTLGPQSSMIQRNQSTHYNHQCL
jgi:hypothetical protein